MTQVPGGDPAARRACIERTLANYPNLDSQAVADVRHWFRKEASALDVALLATNQDLAEAYRRFRADHVDRLTRGDIVRAILFVAAAAAIIVLIAWRAL
jgi:hypothetical protein